MRPLIRYTRTLPTHKTTKLILQDTSNDPGKPDITTTSREKGVTRSQTYKTDNDFHHKTSKDDNNNDIRLTKTRDFKYKFRTGNSL